MKILVTGATSYLGINLTKTLALQENTKIFAIVRASSQLQALSSKVSVFKSDSSFDAIETIVREIKPDVVIHLAAALALDARQIPNVIEANITLGTTLLEAMIKNNCQCFIHTGTFWEEMQKSQEYNPVNLYAATKRAFLNIAEFYCKAYGLQFINLRLFGVYGPHDPRKKFFSLLKEGLANQIPIKLTPGEQVMDLIYIDDVVDAYKKAIAYILSAPKGNWQEVEIGTGNGMKLRQIVAAYENCVKKSLNIEWGALPYRKREVMHRIANIAKAEEILQWQPQYSIHCGIEKMLELEGLAR